MSSPASRYTLAQTRSSLIAAAVICAVHLITLFLGIGGFLGSTLALLALLGGPIATYRGSLKLGFSIPATIGIVLISFFPPVAVIVHIVLLFRLQQKQSETAPVVRPSYPVRLTTPPQASAPIPVPTPPPATGSRAMPPPWPGAAQPTEEPQPREFFLIRNNERCGPYSESVFRSLIQAGEVQGTDFCWTEGWDDWKPVRQAWK